jgi:hypothetical protein
MGSVATGIMMALYGLDVYDGYVPEFSEDLHGGGFPEIFAELFERQKPRVVFEIGAWKGRSSIMLANLLKQHCRDGAVVCVDTWLGCLEHLPPEISESWSIQRYRRHGYPRLYQQFLSNVVRAQVQDCVVPFPNTSSIAAEWLKQHNVRADLIFVDGSHEFADVLSDIRNYYPLLAEGGVIFGDDYSGFEGVSRAVNHFVDAHDLRLDIREGQVWIVHRGVRATPLRPGEPPFAIKSLVKRLAHVLGYRPRRGPGRRPR